jgi:three-Cys-motif partner protein
MASNKNFFLAPQAAAIYKHELLKRYIPAWAGKVGSTSPGKRVVVYDAYSGPGRYEDEQRGSPEILVDTAVAMENLRSVLTIFSEKDRTHCDKLRTMLSEKGVDNSTYEVREGPVEQHIDDVVALAADLPLFVFLDPYGFTLPFDKLVDVLKRRDKPGYSPLRPKTEVLINFSFEAVRRNAGALTGDTNYPAREGQIRSLDTFLGDNGWQDLVRDGDEKWIWHVLSGYAQRVRAATGYGYISARVADSLRAEPVYVLILFTRHPDGLWKMMDAMSFARKRWREWLVDRREEAMGGQGEIRGLDWDDDEGAWIDEIARNIEGLLVTEKDLVIERRLAEVMGSTLCLARETHITKALDQLHERGVVRKVTGRKQKAQIARM